MYVLFGVALVWGIVWFYLHNYWRRGRDVQIWQSMLKFELVGDLLLFGCLVFASGMLVHDFAQREEPGASHRSCVALAFKEGYETRASAVPFLEECMRGFGSGWEIAADETLHPGCSRGTDSHYNKDCWLPLHKEVRSALVPHDSAILR